MYYMVPMIINDPELRGDYGVDFARITGYAFTGSVVLPS
jgi:hypothetical protein